MRRALATTLAAAAFALMALLEPAVAGVPAFALLACASFVVLRPQLELGRA